MPRAFDSVQMSADFDPTTSFSHAFDGSIDLVKVAEEAFESMVQGIITWIKDNLGLDLQWVADNLFPFIDAFVTLFGELNPLGGSFDPAAALVTFFQLIVTLISDIPALFTAIEGMIITGLANLLSGFNILDLLGGGSILTQLFGAMGGSGIGSLSGIASIFESIPVIGPLIEAIFGGLGITGATGGLGDLTSGLAGWVEQIPIIGPLIDAIFGGLGIGGSGSSLGDLTSGLLGWVEEIPFIGPMLSALTGSSSGGLGGLLGALGDLLNGSSSLFSGNLFGSIGAGLLGNVSASHVAAISPNLIVDGEFNTAATLVADAAWSWDGTQDHSGIAGSGSAKVTANGLVKDLSSDLIPVVKDQVLAGEGWVMWSALAHAGGTTPIRLALTTYHNTGTANTPVWSVVGTPDLAVDSSGLAGSGWRKLAGSYTIPTGVEAVRLRCHVDASATAGIINWDDLSLTKTQPIATSMVGGLDGLLSGFTGGIAGILDQLGLHVLTTDFQSAITALTGGLGHTISDITSWVSGLLTGSSTLNGSNIGTGFINLFHLPDVQTILDNILGSIGGLFGITGTHAEVAAVLTQQTNALVGAQAAIQQLQSSTTALPTPALDTFNRSGSIGANWAAMPVGGTVLYPHGGGGSQSCDGNNLAWSTSGNTPHTKLLRWVGPNQRSGTDFQNVGLILSSRGEDPFLGETSYDHILCRVSDDGLNYVRGQFSAYAGNDDDIQLFYCIGGVETSFYVGGFSPVVGAGSAINVLAGQKGANARTYTIYVNSNPIVTVTESGAVSMVGEAFRGWGCGQSAGNNMGIFPFLRQAKPGSINQWTGVDQ